MKNATRRLAPIGAFLVCAVPAIAIGGVHATWIAVSAGLGLAFFALVAWQRTMCERRPLRLGWVGIAFCAATAATALQLIPLPPSWLAWLSPKAHELFEFTLGPFGLYNDDAWRPLSLDPRSTAQELVRLCGLTLAYLAARNGFADRRETTQAYGAIIGLGVLLVAIGVGQKLSGTTTILGVYESPLSRNHLFVSTFVNPNHLAGFLVLASLLAFGLAASEEGSRNGRVGAGLAGVVLGTGCVLTLSRAGILALGIGGLLLMLMLLRSQSGRGRRVVVAAVLCVAAAGVGALFAWDRLAMELSPSQLAQELGTNLKVQMWKDSLPMVLDFPWAGVGKGAFAHAFPMYQTNVAQYTFTHVESLPLELAIDLGLPVAAFVLVVLLFKVGGLLLRSVTSATAGAVAGLVALFLHNLADYNLSVSGVAFAAVVVLGLVLRRDRGPASPRPASPWRPRTFATLAVGGACAAAIAAGALYVRNHTPEEAIARVSAASGDAAELEAAAVRELRHHPSDYLVYLAAATRLSRDAGLDLKRAMRFANRALYLNGPSHKPHLVTARILAQLGRPSQAALEYKLAARRQSTLWERCFAEVARLAPGLRWLRVVADEPGLQPRLARYLHHTGRDADAVTVLTEHLLLEPTDPKALALIARVELARSKPQAALPWIERLARQPERRTTALLLRAHASAALGQVDEALSVYARLRVEAPTRVEAYLRAAGLHLGRKEGGKAREVLEALLRVDVKAAATAQFGLMLAQAYELEGRRSLALREYRLVLARDPKHAEVKARVEALEKTLDALGAN